MRQTTRLMLGIGAVAVVSASGSLGLQYFRPSPTPDTLQASAQASPQASAQASTQASAQASTQPTSVASAARRTDALSPSDRSLRAAEAMVAEQPNQAQGYQRLCVAYMQKARESGDFGLNRRAEEALATAIALDPSHPANRKLTAVLHLVYHRFAEGLEVARAVVEAQPNDWEAYGALVDAHVELGNYPEAFEAAQRMVDLRPNTASYSRVSYLRSLQGDTQGAIETMTLAIQASDPSDAEARAWCLVHLAFEQLNAGDPASANISLDQALRLMPQYHTALAAKGMLHAAAGDRLGAIAYYQQATARIALPDTLIALGELLESTGQIEAAEKQYQEAELAEQLASLVPSTGSKDGTTIQPSEMAQQLLAPNHIWSRQLALFWADHNRRLDEALQIAQREHQMRKDIYSSDILAWCLYRVGKFTEARAAIRDAMRLGTKDARILYHAGMISAKLGDKKKARQYLTQALTLNPAFSVLQADVAKKTLQSL